MSNPHSLPDNGTQATESGLLINDWNLTEKNLPEDAAPFDGKIIARMPDLSSNGFAKNTTKRNPPSLGNWWNHIRLSLAPFMQERTHGTDPSFMGTRLQFFQRVSTFGGVLLLCGIGLLFLDQNDKEPTKDSHTIVNILSDHTEAPAKKTTTLAQNESTLPSSVTLLESNNLASDSNVAIPVADFAAVQNSVANSAEHAEPIAVWNRPVSNTYSPWDVAPKQPESSPPSPGVVAAVPPSAPLPAAVAMAPMLQMSAPPMTAPSISMPVSAYERQLVAQANPPTCPPVDPFIQTQTNNAQVPPGMMPMHERLENMMNAPPQNAQRSASATPPYQPLATGQNNQRSSYSVPPNYYAPPSNTPIPSGVSTLPSQNGYYPQNSPGNFYPDVPPAYHRVY